MKIYFELKIRTKKLAALHMKIIALAVD